MHTRINVLALTAAVATMAAIFITYAPSASAAPTPKCPAGGTPAPGSTITGGLEVSGGDCWLTNVTVHGGITVDEASLAQLICCPTNSANLNGSTVDGGVVVHQGGQILTGVDSSFSLTHQHSTINGGVTAYNSCCLVLTDAKVHGGFTMDGAFDWPLICDSDPFCFLGAPLCGNDIYGNVVLHDVNTDQVFIGDIGEQFFENGDCTGNTIHGSVLMSDSNFVRKFDGEPSEIEGNRITGSVHVDHSTAEVNENTIGGSLLCTNGTVIHPGAPPDNQGNTVRGRDTCD